MASVSRLRISMAVAVAVAAVVLLDGSAMPRIALVITNLAVRHESAHDATEHETVHCHSPKTIQAHLFGITEEHHLLSRRCSRPRRRDSRGTMASSWEACCGAAEARGHTSCDDRHIEWTRDAGGDAKYQQLLRSCN